VIRAEYLRREDRKRFAVSLAGALVLYVFIAGLALVSGLIHTESLADLPGTVWVDLSEGGSTGAPTGNPAGTEATGPALASTPRVVTPSVPAPATPTPAPRTAAAAATTAPTKAPTSSAPPALGTPTGTPGAAADTGLAGAESWVPGSRPAGSRVLGTESGQPGGTGALTQTALTTVVSGSEKGYSMETVLGARAGKAGRSLYVPIYFYLPPPRSVEASVVGRIPAEYRAAFFKSYTSSGENWILSREVPIPERDDIWLALEKGGFNFAAADYLAGGNLKPVVLSFVVTPAGAGVQSRLEAVTVTSGSGDPQVDAAVVYGFGRASFFNATDGTIGGTFTYRFSK
jgi:hypothetical protein